MKYQLVLAASLFFITQKAFSDGLDLTFKTPCNPKNQEATLSFVGDILIHQALYQAVMNESKHFNQLWKPAESLIQKADFSVGNLEGPVALGIDHLGHDHGDIGFVYDGEVYSGTNYTFNYHPRLLSDLQASGFDLITTANNHAMDRFSIGIDRTISAAQNINFPTVGTHKTNDPNGDFFKIVSIKNMRVAFLGCTEVINIPDNDKLVLNCEGEKIFAIIKDVSSRSDVDALVLLPHWGVEYSSTAKPYQKEYARRYLDAGAIAVIGSHPHVLEPWEKYVTKNGRETLVIYSLGNFVAGQTGLEKQTGAVAYLGLSKVENQKAKLMGVGYTPTYRVGNLATPIAKNDNKDVILHISKMYGTKNRIEPTDNLVQTLCSSSH